jgi:hypothetical protein
MTFIFGKKRMFQQFCVFTVITYPNFTFIYSNVTIAEEPVKVNNRRTGMFCRRGKRFLHRSARKMGFAMIGIRVLARSRP